MCLKALILHSENEVHVCDKLNHVIQSLLFSAFYCTLAIRHTAVVCKKQKKH